MNCKNLKIRTKNYQKYFYCSLHKCEVCASSCHCCRDREYKEYKGLQRTAIKKKTNKVTKRAQACDIPYEVKEKVWERDEHKCIFCEKEVPVHCANSHYIPRSQGGLGIEQNIVTACPECHHEQDNGKNTRLFDELAEIHLKNCYGSCWNVKNLIYRKGNIA